MNLQQHKKIIICGGGTGGHVFPAISIADELRSRLDDADILFVGAKDRMEMEKVPEAGYKIIGLPVEGFHRKFSLANFRVLVKLMSSLQMARKIIKEFNPHVVVGVGGYASGPMLRTAARRGIPTLIQEQNSYAGLTNRLLARRARKICVAYGGMEKYFPHGKIVLAGNPVRDVIRKIRSEGDRAMARKEFGLDEEARVILVIGGSLGARSINTAVKAGLQNIDGTGIKLIWQCGSYYYKEMSESLRDFAPGQVILHQFIERMDHAYLAADVVVARAGAITISELCHAGKPAILVPSPNVAEDHQTKNAMALVEQSAAICIPDSEAETRMMKSAMDLLEDPGRRDNLAKNIESLAIPGSSGRIAGEIISIMN